jgi:hypothetical protein
MDNVLWCGLSVTVLVYRVYTANKRVTSSFYNRQRRRSGKMYLDAPFLQEALPQSCAAVRTTSSCIHVAPRTVLFIQNMDKCLFTGFYRPESFHSTCTVRTILDVPNKRKI